MLSLGSRKIFAAGNGIAYGFLQREDGRFVCYRTYGGSTVVLSIHASKAAAKREAQNRAALDRAVAR